MEIENGLEQFKSHPIMILWGEKDFCFTLRFLKEWELRFPEARVFRFPEAGHYVLEDAFQMWRETIPYDHFKDGKWDYDSDLMKKGIKEVLQKWKLD